ncbi:HEAT repeat domain-containing protein [Streptomyces sp. NPDC058964]|uniref:HEAT repeat domain-containing protein n=1 Tax=Streptomyces sp. NPDC058964 TaxID=3346681 RepID=UPI0036BED3AA
MDLATVFADLDRVAWPELHHAYGPADDLPDLLRAVTASDEETAAEAEQELWSGIVHQGTVYGATAAAVPFLARLAAAGVRRGNLLGMLGAIAESGDEHRLDQPGAARAAVVAHLPLMLPLLSDSDAEVRQCAAWAVARCGQTAGPDGRTALRRRWAEVATLLGPAARPVTPRLLPMLDRPDTAAAAARALVAAHPGSDRPAGITLTSLVDRVLPAAAPGASLNSALAALEALAALGAGAFTPGQPRRVQLLADGERRIVGSGIQTGIIHNDTEMRAAARGGLWDRDR